MNVWNSDARSLAVWIDRNRPSVDDITTSIETLIRDVLIELTTADQSTTTDYDRICAAWVTFYYWLKGEQDALQFEWAQKATAVGTFEEGMLCSLNKVQHALRTLAPCTVQTLIGGVP